MTQEIILKPKQDPARRMARIALIAGGALIFLGILVNVISHASTGVIFLVLGLLVAVVPVSGHKYLQYRKYHQMEDNFPNFLKDFSEAIKSGMNFVQAFKVVSKSDYGPLSDEIRRSANQLSWGMPFPKVLTKLADRMRGSKVIRQSFTIINEAYTSGGDIAETMDSIAMNISSIRDIDEERKSILSQQVYIMYFIYFLFLGIIYALYKLMEPMLDINVSAAGAGFSGMGFGGAVNYCLSMQWLCSAGIVMGYNTSDPMTYFRVLFLLMLIVQGCASGVLAGELSEGNATAGIKHAGIMVITAIIVFILFI